MSTEDGGQVEQKIVKKEGLIKLTPSIFQKNNIID